jgi:hypothetical protein
MWWNVQGNQIHMRLRLTGPGIDIARLVNGFSASYHKDYFEVRPLAHRWSAEEQPTAAVVGELSTAVRRVLRGWGAGKREAPTLNRQEDFVATFTDVRLHREVGRLSQIARAGLGVDGQCRRLIDGSHVSAELKNFDETLLSALHDFYQRLFVNNTNVTYPMKVLLLVSGLMPALDSQVRAGLGRAGFRGVNKTQFLLPETTGSADGKKLTRLPFVLGQCWADFATQFRDGILQSNFAGLLQEPARVFDVLLFMQAKDSASPPLTLQIDAKPWYDLD